MPRSERPRGQRNPSAHRAGLGAADRRARPDGLDRGQAQGVPRAGSRRRRGAARPTTRSSRRCTITTALFRCRRPIPSSLRAQREACAGVDAAPVAVATRCSSAASPKAGRRAHSDIALELEAEDAKAVELWLINAGMRYVAGGDRRRRGDADSTQLLDRARRHRDTAGDRARRQRRTAPLAPRRSDARMSTAGAAATDSGRLDASARTSTARSNWPLTSGEPVRVDSLQPSHSAASSAK